MKLANAMPYVRRAVAIARWAFAPLAVIFLIFAATKARTAFTDAVQHAQLAPFVATIAIWALLHLLPPAFAWTALAGTGSDIPYSTALRIHLARLPARYLPGGVWQTVSRVADLNRLGASRAQLSVLVILENLLPPALALVLGSACMALAGKMPWLALVGIGCGLILMAAVPLLLRHPLLLHRQRLPLRTYLQLVMLSTIFWTCAAAAFISYWAAVSDSAAMPHVVEIGGAYLLSWVAGFVAIFAPQGIGVFEASIGVFFKGAMTFSGIVVLAAGFRAAILLADALAYGLFLVSRLHLRLPGAA